MKLTAKQILQIAAEAMADPRTVKRIYSGEKSLQLVKDRVAAAAKRLRMPLARGAR
jgi:hypothetical protein